MNERNGIKPDFLVMGAGIIGLATAERLLAKGARVTILERSEVGQESSWAGGGILSPLCPWDYSDDVTCLTSSSAAIFPTWVAALHETTGIDAEYETSGMLILPSFDKQNAQQWCTAHRVKVEEKSTRLPFFSASYKTIAYQQQIANTLFMPTVAQVRNPRLLRALQKQVSILGGEIIENCAVREITTSNEKVQKVMTTDGVYQADRYIVTAGAWTQALLGKHALNLNIKPSRGQMLLFKFASPPLQHILLQNNLYLIPRRDGHLLIGSTLEDVGFNKETTTAARNNLFQRAQKLLPTLNDMPLVKQWSGLRPASPQNIPTIGQHPLINNLYINSGHFRYGVTMAPASAEILLNEITGIAQPFDTTAYRTGWGITN
jgi:glycine oxidase